MQREFGRYRVIRHLATGGMGEVYLAEAVGAAGFAKRVVIKTLRADLAADGDLVQQFIAEGQLLEALDHPNIAQILDLGLQDGTYFLAIEFVEGFDLRALQRALPPQDEAQRLREASVLHVVAAVARALDHAATRKGPDGRALGIVHHDVTPSNVMVRRDGHVKLVDFGVARSALVSRLAAGALRGKLPYLSPEHARHQPVDGRADLFALGLCAYEWLSGQRALEVADPEALEDAYARLAGKLDALQAAGLVAPGTLQLLVDLTSLDPAGRPRTAGEVADRAEQRLIELGEASPARTFSAELEPAFAQLEARARSFDQTLAQMLGLGEEPPPGEKTGTLSLPGMEVVAIAAASAQDEPAASQPARRRWRKRWVSLGLAMLVLAAGAGFWFGARRLPPPEPLPTAAGVPIPPQVVVLPVPVTPSVGAAVAVAEPVTPTKPIAAAPSTVPPPRPQPPLPLPEPATRTADDPPSTPARKKEKPDKTGTLRFRVRPADAVVYVDGEVVRRAGLGDRYEIRLTPGDHRLRVVDPATGTSKTLTIDDLADGEVRTIEGGVCLADCPDIR